jgi:hypothetical protein
MAANLSEADNSRATGRSAATLGNAEPSSKDAPITPIGMMVDITLRYFRFIGFLPCTYHLISLRAF